MRYSCQLSGCVIKMDNNLHKYNYIYKEDSNHDDDDDDDDDDDNDDYD